MIPITTEDGILKFLKKGRSLNEELYYLFKHTFPTEDSFEKLPQEFKDIAIKAEINNDRNLIALAVKSFMSPIINGLYKLKVIRGTQITIQEVQLTEERQLYLVES